MPDNKYWIVPLLGLGVLSLCVGDDQEHSNEFEYAYKHAVKADQCNERSTDCLNNINPCYKHGQAANIVDGSRPYPHGQAPNVVDGSRPTLQMVEIPGGKFIMGNNNSRFRNERDIPARWVEINTFYMDVYAVSNAEFEVFVNANNYKTEAEKLGESIVDEVDISEEIKSTIYEAFAEMTWWLPVKGADWKHPEGPDSSILGKMPRNKKNLV
ncbi:formylglycine-generating enzyme [Procambarus clarkii]|uniref:formylglycine-generating enzyme n=1 Tax=Procambarus clarkii TaxID=6728 RepID=UPI003742A011